MCRTPPTSHPSPRKAAKGALERVPPILLTCMLSDALQFVLHHRRLAWLTALMAVLCGGLAMLRGHYGTRIDGIFPEGSKSANAMALLAESGLSNRLMIDCDATQCPGGLDEEALAFLDSAVARLTALPGVREVRFRTLPENLPDNLEGLLPAIPQLLLPPEVTSERADEVVRNALKQLMMPTPGTTTLLRDDPFGLRNQLLLRLQSLRQVTGLQFDDTKPFLCSQNGRHALIVLELDIPYSDSAASRQFITQINEVLNSPQAPDPFSVKGAQERVPPTSHLPPLTSAGEATAVLSPPTSAGEAPAVLSPLTFHLIGAHLHTIGNEDTIRRDLTLIGVLSPIFLLALFLVVFRGDWRCFWIPLIPAAATIVVAGVLATLDAPLQLFVLGLGGSILGLAVDQGIHVYIACREKEPLQRLASLAKPLALGAGTSIAVFLLLVFTRSPALQQLGFLAGGALALSLLTSFFLLPTLLARRIPYHAPYLHREPKPLPVKPILLVAALVTALSFLPKGRTDFRIESLDGIPEQVRTDEAAYYDAWQPAPPNMLLLRDPDGSQTPRLHAELADCHPVSPQTFWPDEATRQQNLDAWRNAPMDEWETLLDSAAIAHGLPKGFFQPFFDKMRQNLTIPASEPPIWLAQAYHQLRRNDISVFFLAESCEQLPAQYDVADLTPAALRTILTRDFGIQLRWLMGAAVGIIFLLTWMTLRSFRRLFLALLPVLLTIRWLTAAFAICGHPFTLMTAIGGVLLVGLAIDYGVFAVQWLDDSAGSGIPHAMLLSAATTIFTTGILLFSRHPVLFDLGLVLAPGITLAYLVARFVVPALSRILRSRGTDRR